MTKHLVLVADDIVFTNLNRCKILALDLEEDEDIFRAAKEHGIDAVVAEFVDTGKTAAIYTYGERLKVIAE